MTHGIRRLLLGTALTTCALALLAGAPARANDNVLGIRQIGAGFNATLKQVGEHNKLIGATDPLDATTRAFIQGGGVTLNTDQTGNGNAIGLRANLGSASDPVSSTLRFTQTGDNHEAVLSIGPPDTATPALPMVNNSVEFTQAGAGNRAAVTVDGAHELNNTTVYVRQDNTSGGFHRARAGLDGHDIDLVIDQSGDTQYVDGDAHVLSTDGRVNININQQGANQRTTFLVTKVDPITTPSSTPNLDVEVRQMGDGNEAVVEQNAPAARAKINQDGFSNYTEVRQFADDVGPSNRHDADVLLTGDDNDVRIRQDGRKAHYAKVHIYGNQNVAHIQQGIPAGGSNAQRVEAESRGDYNRMYITQDGTGAHQAVVNFPTGMNNNRMEINQHGSAAHVANFTIGGNSADIRITQQGSVPQNTTMSISGSGTVMSITQGAP